MNKLNWYQDTTVSQVMTFTYSATVMAHHFIFVLSYGGHYALLFAYEYYRIQKQDIFYMLSMLPLRLAIVPVSCSFLKSLFSPCSPQPLFRNRPNSFLGATHENWVFPLTRRVTFTTARALPRSAVISTYTAMLQNVKQYDKHWC